MIISVSSAMGQSPDWVIGNLTMRQLGFYFERTMKERTGFLEYHASVIWAMANGKFRKNKTITVEDAVSKGLIKEEN